MLSGFNNELFKKGRIISNKSFLSESQKFLGYTSFFVRVFIYKVKLFFEVAVQFENVVNFIYSIIPGVINKVSKGRFKLYGWVAG